MPLTKAEVARLRSLREKKHREELGLFVVEGEKVVGELLASRFPLAEVFATRAWIKENPKSADYLAVVEISVEEMERISHFPTPSPVLGVCRLSRAPLATGTLNRGFTLALDGIQDPGNVGTLIRIADWYGLDRVLVSPDCADVFSPKVIHASMGSFARVTVHTVALDAALADAAIPILGCDLNGDDIHQLSPVRDAIVVIGSEGRGLSPAVAAQLTGRITIPRFGGAESLNAAVAAGIVCDNLRRRAP